ncbi:MAG: HlyC/CorC family transporter [Acidobacteriota bacterium]|nr:MAG: HlyC/CorC family transporter [Acidobacteriota bacterium]
MDDPASFPPSSWSIAFIGSSLGLAGLMYVVLSLAIAARLALGRLAAERVAEASGLDSHLDPGSRTWTALELVRHLALVAAVLLGALLMPPPRGLLSAAASGVVLVLCARVLEALAAPRSPERIIQVTAPLLAGIDRVIGPLVSPLGQLHEALLSRKRREGSDVDEELRDEQIEEYIRDGVEEGLIEREQSELLREIVDVGDQVVREVMTPRTEVQAVSADTDLAEIRETLIRSRHSRLPVYEGSLDRVVGVLALRQVLSHLVEPRPGVTARDLMLPVMMVPASKRVLELLRELQGSRQQMAVVVDEFGGTAGLVTLEDLVEEIVGEIRDEHETVREALVAHGEGVWQADGRLALEDLEEALDRRVRAEGVETLGGLVFSRLGRIPKLGERVQIAPDLVVEVTRLEGRRIASVRVRLVGSTSPAAGADKS